MESTFANAKTSNCITNQTRTAMQRNKNSFKGQKIFIGIDVHKRNWDVAIAPAVGNVKRHTQKASARELFDFLKKHYPDGDYLAVYESGFSGYSTFYALK